ncbi:MAG: YebC/PmpR family DNA-binding transcriptional regulator, partial [Mucispirillum sp.]|nr:YebC/PmpR family DNA-binding transcriptional regulator [Mucispirillum sp.]
KEAQDNKKGKIFTKIARELTVAAKIGGGDPSANSRLRLALDKARSANMPKDNVERAIKKGTGEGNDQVFEDITYEGYAPGGIGILVKTLTDNRNRTIMEVRTVITKRGGSMAEAGAVAWQFENKGIIEVPISACSEDDIMNYALEAGAEDVVTDGDIYSVTTEPSEFEAVKKILEDNKLPIDYAELTMKPKTTIDVDGDAAKKLIAMVEALEDLDDVQEVYGNYKIDDSVFDEME